MFAALAVVSGASCRSPLKPSEATFTITGLVTSSVDHLPLQGVAVQASGTGVDGRPALFATTTDVSGRYSIAGLRGQISVTWTRFGYQQAGATVQLTQDTVVDLEMTKGAPPVYEGGQLIAGTAISGSISPGDDHCDPRWDQNSPCRRFGLNPEIERNFGFTLRFPDCELELHVFRGDQRILYAGPLPHPVTRTINLEPGYYEVRLMAYYSCGLFELTVK